METRGKNVGRETNEPVYYMGDAPSTFSPTLSEKIGQDRIRKKSPSDSLSIGDALMMFPQIREDWLNKPNILNYLEGYKESEIENLNAKQR